MDEAATNLSDNKEYNMTDTGSLSDRVNAAIAAAHQAVADLRAELAPKLAELGDTINAKVDAVQDAVAEISEAIDARQAE